MMKRLFRITSNEIKKKCANPILTFCIMGITLLCFTGIVSVDAINGRNYTCLDMLLDSELRKVYNISIYQMLSASIGSYMTMFVPLIAAIPYILSISEERRKNNIIFRLSRIGKKAYFFSEYLSAIFSAGLVLLGGVIIYFLVGLLCLRTLPNYSELRACIKLLCGVFLYGMNSVQLAFVLSAFVENMYICCTLPFAITYAFYVLLSKLTAVSLQNMNYEMFMKIQALYKSNLVYIFEQNMYYEITIIYAIGFQIVSVFLYIVIWSKRNR